MLMSSMYNIGAYEINPFPFGMSIWEFLSCLSLDAPQKHLLFHFFFFSVNKDVKYRKA